MKVAPDSRIVLAAPSQNRLDFKSNIERIMPLLAARQLNAISQPESPIVELWNNYGAKMDRVYDEAGSHVGRAEYNQALIGRRYDYYREIGLVGENTVQVLTDDSRELSEWVLQKVYDLRCRGVIFDDVAEVYVCDICHHTIGLVTGRNVSRLACQVCQVDEKHTEKRQHMFMRLNTAPPRVILPRNSRHILSHSGNLPERAMVERHRKYGLRLTEFGSGYSLDPKIIISMMYEYVARRHNISSITVVQGIETLYNTAPYAQTVSDLELDYILTPRIPTGIGRERVDELGAGFLSRYLPLFLVGRSSGVSEGQMLDLKREYDRVRAYMEKMSESNPCSDAELGKQIAIAKALMSDVESKIHRYDVRSGVVSIGRGLVKHMGRSGLFSAALANNRKIMGLKEGIGQVYGG